MADYVLDRNRNDEWYNDDGEGWDDDDEEGFIGYVPTARDPGLALLFLTCLVCFISLACLPCLVILGMRYEARRLARRKLSEVEEQEQKRRMEEEGRDDDVSNEVANKKWHIRMINSLFKCKSENVETSPNSGGGDVAFRNMMTSKKKLSQQQGQGEQRSETGEFSGTPDDFWNQMNGSSGDSLAHSGSHAGCARPNSGQWLYSLRQQSGTTTHGHEANDGISALTSTAPGEVIPVAATKQRRKTRRRSWRWAIWKTEHGGDFDSHESAAAAQEASGANDDVSSTISEFIARAVDMIVIPSYPDKNRRHGEHRHHPTTVSAASNNDAAENFDTPSASASSTSHTVKSSNSVHSDISGVSNYSNASSFIEHMIEGKPRRTGPRGNKRYRAVLTERAKRVRREGDFEDGQQMKKRPPSTRFVHEARGYGADKLSDWELQSGETNSRCDVTSTVESYFSSRHRTHFPRTLPTLRSGYAETFPYVEDCYSAEAAGCEPSSEQSFGLQSVKTADISPMDAADAYDQGKTCAHDYSYPCQGEAADEVEVSICCGENPLWKPSTIKSAFASLVPLFEFDDEMRRIVKLAVPFTISEVMETIFDSINIALVSLYLGTDSVAAAAMVDIFIGMTEEFIGGAIDAQITLTSHALGMGNNYLVGQYFQLSFIVYTLGSIPEFILWWFAVKPAILWFGLSENVANIGQDFARVTLFHEYQDAVAECLHGIYEVTGHEVFSTIMGLLEECVGVVIAGVLVTHMEGVTLSTLAYYDILLGVIFLIMSFVIPLRKGWLTPFLPGMFWNFAPKNRTALWNLLKTAAPLSFGELLAYGEWEILTVFIAHLGPAEVASWALLGYVWETFEACTEGIGDAAEVRVGYHLGKGRPGRARESSFKSLVLATFVSCIVTSILFMLGNDLPKILTNDPAMQHMISAAIPLVGIGNLTMTFGMVCWALIGAQGRYTLATKVATFCSWIITTPLAALFVYGFNFNLEGVVAAVAIGYSICGMFLAYILLRSDWPRLSKNIQEINAQTGDVYSSDEESSSSSSSSDDSSSSDESSSSSSSSSSSNSDADGSSIDGSKTKQGTK